MLCSQETGVLCFAESLVSWNVAMCMSFVCSASRPLPARIPQPTLHHHGPTAPDHQDHRRILEPDLGLPEAAASTKWEDPGGRRAPDVARQAKRDHLSSPNTIQCGGQWRLATPRQGVRDFPFLADFRANARKSTKICEKKESRKKKKVEDEKGEESQSRRERERKQEKTGQKGKG